MEDINIQNLDDIQLALFLAVKNYTGINPSQGQTYAADAYYEWLQKKRKQIESKKLEA